ncbi:MAG TPA: hypothetical protein PK869_13170, partial [Candidatus Hydrogenedentes bacterium]|nr:hypothetical protein [Candidatus Hydrogenedentota bacterium]
MRPYLALLIVLGLGFSGCNPAQTPSAPAEPGETKSAPAPTADAKTKVAFVSNNTSDFWIIAEAGTRKAEAELGCEVIFKRPATGT